MNNYFVILAAGKGKRFNKKKPKQYYFYKNKELYEHSIDKLINSKKFRKIILVVDNSKKIKNYNGKITVIKGGKERSDSTIKALKYIKKFNPTNVFIHDAARPNFSLNLVEKIFKNLKKFKAVVPIVNSKDSIKYKIKNKIFNLEKKKTLLTQTPQAFRFKDLYNFAIKEKDKISDESTLFIDRNLKVKFIQGENQNSKITFLDDIRIPRTFYGIGFDIHKQSIKGDER